MHGEMGARLSEHRGKFSAGGWLWYVGGLLVLAAVFSVGNGIGEIQRGEATVVQVLSISAVSAAIGALLLISPILRWRQVVTCHENGLVWTRLIGTKTIGRGAVKSATLIGHRGRYGNYDEVEIRTSDGTVSIKGIAEAQQLANHLHAWLSSGPASHARGPETPSPSGSGWSPPESGGWIPPT